MEQQGIVEPVEEVGYKNRPPLLEDVSIEGPTRTPIPHSLDTLEQRELIEDDYNWWRYSKFALPWLLFLFLLFCTLWCLTALEQVGTIQQLRDGVPAYLMLQETANLTTEGNMKKVLRNLRITVIFCMIVPTALAFLVLYAKPRPLPRKLLHYLCMFLIFSGMVMAWVCFGLAESPSKRANRCLELQMFTNERCEQREGPAVTANILDFVLAISGITALAIMFVTVPSGDFKLNRTGWRQRERDAETEALPKNPYNIKAHNVRNTRLLLTSIALFWLLLVAIAQTIFIVILHQDHVTIQLRYTRGRADTTLQQFTDRPFAEPGWSARNTRLRYAICGIGILTIMANLIPWRSRVIAYVFAFIYAVLFAMSIVMFALDVHELRRSRRDIWPKCPVKWFNGFDIVFTDVATNVWTKVRCIHAPYIATAVFDFFVLGALFIYLLNEYFLRYKSIHSGRKYVWFEIRKIEQELDSRRPVRCEITSEVMTAAEYYYHHRFLTEPEMFAAASSSSSSDSSSSAPGGIPPLPYDPLVRPNL